MRAAAGARPLKVALFVHYFYPEHIYGTEAYTLSVARELMALGHEPTVVTATGAGEPGQAEFLERYDWQGVPVWRIDKNAYPNQAIVDTYEQPELRAVHERLLRAIAPDLVHVTHLINHTSALLEVTAAMGIPTFATLTDFFGFCANNRLEAADGSLCAGPNPLRSNCIACYLKDAAAAPWASRKLKVAARPLAREALAEAMARTAKPGRNLFNIAAHDLVRRPGHLRERYEGYRAMVAPTKFLRDAYAANGFSRPLVLSHFGIDIDRSPKPTSAEPETARLGFVGQMAPHKGVHLLLEAMRAIGSPRLALDIWGSESQAPDYAAKLRKMAEGLPVRFRGTFAAERTAEILAETDVLAIPSTWYENSPLILLQALATHTPVVVADVLGLTEFVTPERSGLVFARGNAGALASVLRRFADDPTLARRMSETTAYTRAPADMVAELVETWLSHAPEQDWSAAPAASAPERRTMPLALAPIEQRVAMVDRFNVVAIDDCGDAFLRLVPSVGPTAPTPPLLIDDPDLTEDWYAPWHAAHAGMTPDIGVYVLRDGLYHPHGMVMADAHTALTAPNLMPKYWREAIAEQRVLSVDRPDDPLIVDRSVIACMTPGFHSFGHILLETLPRLWLARRLLGDRFDDCLIPVHGRFPAWALELLQTVAGVDPARCLRLEDDSRNLRSPLLIAPSMLHLDFYWHPFAATFFDGLPASDRVDLPRAFAIRRPREIAIEGAANRRSTDNIDALEARLEARGLPLISPEDLPFADQVALFRHAELIVGEYGSALHGAIFSPASTRVLSLGFFSDVQTQIAAFRGQRMAYLAPSLDEQREGVRYAAFDPDRMERALDLIQAEAVGPADVL